MPIRLGALVLGAAALAVWAPSAGSSPAAGPSLAAIYKVTIGVKGGASSSDRHGGVSNGDMVTVSTSASYTVEGTVPMAMLTGGAPRRGLPTDGGAYAQASVKGTWSARGTKWVDVVNEVTGPFTCAGTIGTHVTPQLSLSWKRSGSVLRFTLAAVQQELYADGLEGCASGVSGDPVNGSSPELYESAFSVPVASVGNRTITAQVAGPLLEARKRMLHNCASVAVTNCSLAWHGVVRFTLERLIRYPG